MLREVGESLKKILSTDFNQVEFYEGQFERFDEEIVYPPACYIEYVSGQVAENDDPLGKLNLVLHVLTSRLERDPGNMLDILETIIDLIHDKGIKSSSGQYLGHVLFAGFRNTIIHDGLSAFEVDILVDRG